VSEAVIWEIEDDARAVEGLDADGRPDPAYAAALGLVRAPLGRRAAAAAVDAAAYVVLQLPFLIFALPLLLMLLTGRISLYGFVNHPQFVLAVVMAGGTTALTLAFCITQLVLQGRRGLTLGKALLGLRAVNVKTLERPGFWRSVLRVLVLSAAAAVVLGLVLFLLSPLFDPQRRGRGWHDKAAQMWLVDVRRGLNPYDEKRMRIARKTVAAAPTVAPPQEMPSLATPVDASAEPAYRPGARVSAGVLGVARPSGGGSGSVVGIGSRPAEPPVPAPAPAPTAAPAPAPPRQPAPVPTPQPGPTPVPRSEPAAVPAASSSVPASPAAAAGAAPIPQPRLLGAAAGFVLRLDSGETIPVDVDVVLGRNPSAEGALPVRVADDTRSLSKTHVLLRPADEGIVVIDQNSTNGTSVVQAGAERALPAGAPALVLPGETIRFGERTAVVARA